MGPCYAGKKYTNANIQGKTLKNINSKWPVIHCIVEIVEVRMEGDRDVAVEADEAKSEDSIESMTTVKDEDAVYVEVGKNAKQGETHT